MATNIRLSVAFGQQEKPLKWSGGSGSADALLAAVKAKFRAKGELYLEANGAPVTDATRLRNGLVVTLRKGRPPGGIPRAKADAAPRSPVSVLDLDAPKVPPLRLATNSSGAAAAVSRVDDLMGRILAYVRAAEGVALPAVSRRFKDRAVIPSGRGRYFLETEEDSLRRFSRARAEHRKGTAGGRTAWNPMSRVASDLLDAQLQHWLARSVRDPDAPGSALLVEGWDRRSAGLVGAFRDLAARLAAEPYPAPEDDGAPLRGASRASTTALRRGDAQPETTDVDFCAWAAALRRREGSAHAYHSAKVDRSIARLRCLDGDAPLRWAVDAAPTLRDVAHAFAVAQARRRVRHRPLGEIRWGSAFGSAHVAVHATP